MDILAHGLYGSAAFLNKSKRSYWTAFWWGIFPDLAAFGVFTPVFFLMRGLHPSDFQGGSAVADNVIPAYVHHVYNYSHSLVFFTAVFLLVWMIKDRPVYEMLAWGLHIVMDIPSHDGTFFPTPFLHPLSSFYINGIPWGTPWFFFSYWGLLAALYTFIFLRRRRKT